VLWISCLTSALLSGADLTYARLSYADLTGADLTDANLTRVYLINTRLHECVFEPSHIPSAEQAARAHGWDTIQWEDPTAATLLRDDAKKFGLRRLERSLTGNIARFRNRQEERHVVVRLLYLVLFDWTCAYGAQPWRPLLWLLPSIAGFSLYYARVIKRNGNSSI